MNQENDGEEPTLTGADTLALGHTGWYETTIRLLEMSSRIPIISPETAARYYPN